MPYNYSLKFSRINFRERPELYEIGRGEQGVLLIEPYKSEILPHWKFKTEEFAKKSAKKIFSLFNKYKREGDFVGMDMARKFLQMGFTRARRYANHPSGRKYSDRKSKNGKRMIQSQASDWKTNEKAKAAKIFFDVYSKVKNDKKYLKLKDKHHSRQTAKISRA